jgi:hypothetical protein
VTEDAFADSPSASFSEIPGRKILDIRSAALNRENGKDR